MPAPTKKVQTMITEKDVLDRLSKVKGPDLEGDIVSLGMVGGIQIDGDKVIFSITVPAERSFKLFPRHPNRNGP